MHRLISTANTKSFRIEINRCITSLRLSRARLALWSSRVTSHESQVTIHTALRLAPQGFHKSRVTNHESHSRITPHPSYVVASLFPYFVPPALHLSFAMSLFPPLPSPVEPETPSALQPLAERMRPRDRKSVV